MKNLKKSQFIAPTRTSEFGDNIQGVGSGFASGTDSSIRKAIRKKIQKMGKQVAPKDGQKPTSTYM